jgi:hypothetical protein
MTDAFKRRSWGGHAAALARYDRDAGNFITWGGTQPFTWPWWTTYVDEAWLVITKKWIAKALAGGLLPNGFDLARLRDDQARVAA